MDLIALPVETAPDGELLLDDLVRLQLRIARRADELARLHECDFGCSYWQTAERELLPEPLSLSS